MRRLFSRKNNALINSKVICSMINCNFHVVLYSCPVSGLDFTRLSKILCRLRPAPARRVWRSVAPAMSLDLLSDSPVDQPAGEGRPPMAIVGGREFRLFDAPLASAPAPSVVGCSCSAWRVSASKRLCTDMRTCRYVQNVRAVQRLREKHERRLTFAWQTDSTPTNSEVAPHDADAALAATNTNAAASVRRPLPPSASASHLLWRIPQRPSALTDGVGWTAPGGGDATGNVIWPASVLACKIIHAVIKRRQRANPPERKEKAGAAPAPLLSPAPFFDTAPFVSVELGCGAALLTQFLSVIAHPQARLFATDQNTHVATDLQGRVRIDVREGEPKAGDETEESTVAAAEEAEISLSAVDLAAADPSPSSSLRHRLRRFTILPYEWGTPLLSTAALAPLRQCAPDLILGSDLLYFSIAYPKLATTVWELFENYLHQQQQQQQPSSPLNRDRRLKSWMGRRARGAPPCAPAASTSHSSAPTASPPPAPAPALPLLFLAHKSRHAETEQEFWLALSQFAMVYRLTDEFVHGLQEQVARRDGAPPSHLPPADAPSSLQADAAAAAAGDVSWWPLDPLPLDCHDPFLEFFFVLPRVDAASPTEADVAAAAVEAGSPNKPQEESTGVTGDLDEWQQMVHDAAVDFTVPPPLLTDADAAGGSAHWLLRHFPSHALAAWQPKAFGHEQR